MTKELAELIGTFIGDGHADIYQSNGSIHSEIKFCGHRTEDVEYYKKCVNMVFKNLFNVELNLRTYSYKNGSSLVASIDSKAILSFLSKVLNLPIGNKVSISKIPKCVESATDEIKTMFIRGLADTDFCITFKKKYRDNHYYPVISVAQKSKRMIQDLEFLLDSLGFSLYTQYNVVFNDRRGFKTTTHRIYISGRENLAKWINLIGFSNPKHITKYLIWKKLGHCEPYTTLDERKNILNGPGGI